ncbi:extracellular solute-binding protein [Acetobacter cibinongensis]|nr:extracellular solute-binding protein [Acetobacter cibinongensis]
MSLFHAFTQRTVPPAPRAAHTAPARIMWGLGALALACITVSGMTAEVHARTYRHIRHSPASPTLKVLTFGGAIADVQQKVLFAPYSQTEKQTVAMTFWNGEIDSLRKQENTAPTRWAAVMMENSALQISCSLGLLVRDPMDSSSSSCGQPSASIDFAMVWDRAVLDSPPNWSDFWDVARHPGRRSLRRDPRTTLEVALLADGVPPDALYRVLDSREGLDRAFRKLDQLRPYIVWWSTPQEAARILKSGGALMGCAPTGEILNLPLAERSRFGVFWGQRLAINYAWGVPKTVGQDNTALALVAWLEHPTQKQAFANAWPSLPSLTEITSGTADLQHVPPAIAVSDTFWSTHLADISARFERWAEEP